MAITRIKNSTISNKTPKYNDVLAGLPFRPIIGTATDGGNGTSASVAFTGNNPAGAGITYTALSSPGSFTGTGTASPITVSGLTAGTAYTFQVKAGNSLGDSAYSAASNSVTPVTPTAFESIASITLSSSTINNDFTNIPQTYAALQIRFMGRLDDAGSGAGALRIRVGNSTFDTGSNYARHNLEGDGATAAAQAATSQTNIALTAALPENSVTANIVGAGIIDIHDYASTTRNKTFRAFYGQDRNGSGNIELVSGLWMSTSAINQIRIYGDGSGIKAGSVIALYGIKS